MDTSEQYFEAPRVPQEFVSGISYAPPPVSYQRRGSVPANMGCTPIGQPIGINRTRSQPINSREYHGSWEHPNQALNVWDQFYNAAGPSDPRNSLEMLSHQQDNMTKAGVAHQMFQSFQKMSIQKQVMECQELEKRQRELQMNINFYKEQNEKLQSKKENQIQLFLEQIKPEDFPPHEGDVLDSMRSSPRKIPQVLSPRRNSNDYGPSYGTSGLGTEPHSLSSSESYSLEDLSRGLRMPSNEALSDDSNDMNFDYQTTPRKRGNINPDPIVWKAPRTPPRRTDIKIGTPHSVSLMVFLGGIPWDIDEKALAATFRQFGTITVKRPETIGNTKNKSPYRASRAGFIYIVFNQEESVHKLLDSCKRRDSKFYYTLSSKRMKSKDVEVIPWYTADAVSCKRSTPLTQKPASLRVEPKKTVFVGGLHGMMSASLLRKMMKDLFGPVKYVVIDTDKNRYPIGSGRVCFSENQGYQKAIDAEFVEVKATKFTKKIQIDPYVEDKVCQFDHGCFSDGTRFCRQCLTYHCDKCWKYAHEIPSMAHHTFVDAKKNCSPK